MAESIKLPKPKYGQIVVLQKNGDEPRGHGFPLIGVACTIGRCETCDIRVSSADVSLIHCRVVVEEASGEASLEILGQNTEVNGTIAEPKSTVTLSHKDVILVGGRRLRFEYLPPDYKPKPGKVQNGSSDNLRAEVVDTEVELAEPVEPEKETKEPAPVPATPNTSKRVSFGPYLSPEHFDNSLPPATPIKRGATPRRSVRYSGLKFSRPPIESVIEEESPKDEEVSKVVVEETVLDSNTDSTTSEKVDEEVPISDAMSTVSNDEVSEVSNVSVLPSECCSYLDESISVDNSSVFKTDDNAMQTEDNAMSIDIIEPPSVQDTPVASPTTGKDSDDVKATEQVAKETITSSKSNGDTAVVESSPKKAASSSPKVDSEVSGKQLRKAPKVVPGTPTADYTDVRGVKKLLQTPKPQPESPKADYTDVSGLKKLMETPKPSPASPKSDHSNVDGVKKPLQTLKPAPGSPQADYSNVEGMKKLLQTPKPASDSPKADYSNVTGVKELMQTPKPAPESPKADYSDVAGLKNLMQTPKPAQQSPKADYSNVDGIKKLMQPAESPKADYSNVEGVEQLMKTPAVVTVATAVTSSDQNANDSITPKRGARRQSSRVSKAPTTSPKAEFAESQAPPAALMAGDEEEEEVPQEKVNAEESKEAVKNPEKHAVDEKETTMSEQEAEPEKVVKPIVEATPKRGGRKAPVASANKSSTRSRRSKAAEQTEKVEEPQQSTEEVKESTEALPKEEEVQNQELVKSPEKHEAVDESTKAKDVEIQETEESVAEITPKRGGRKAPVASMTKSATRSKRSKAADPAVEEDPRQSVNEAKETVEESSTEQDIPEAEEPASLSPKKPTEEAPVEPEATRGPEGELTEEPSIDKKEDSKETEKTDEKSDQPTPRRGGRRTTAATPQVETKIETPKSTRTRRGQKVDPELVVVEEPQQAHSTQPESSSKEDEASKTDEPSDDSNADAEEKSDEKNAEADKAEVPIGAATPRRGSRKAPVSSATKSASRSRGGQKVESEQAVPEELQEAPSAESESNEESVKETASNGEEKSETNGKEQEEVEKTEVPAVTPKRGGRSALVASVTKSASRSRSQQRAEAGPESPQDVPSADSASSSIEELQETDGSVTKSSAETEEKPAEKNEQEPTETEKAEDPAVSATPKRGGRKAPVASATKASATKSTTRPRRAKVEEQTEELQKTAEETEKAPIESEDQPKLSARPRRGKAVQEEIPEAAEEQAPVKTTGRARRGKAAQDEKPEPEEPKHKELLQPESAKEGEASEVFEPETPVSATPKRGGRKTPAAKESVAKAGRSRRNKATEEDQPDAAQDSQLESAASVSSEVTEDEKPPVTPRRAGRKVAVAAIDSVASPKPTRSKRAKRGSESDATEAVEETPNQAPARATRNKRGRKDSDSGNVSLDKNPVVRLTRMKVLTPVEKAPAARRGRGKQQAEAELVENVEQESSEEVEEEDKKTVVRRGRRGAKAAEDDKIVAIDSGSEPDEAQKPTVRKGRRGAKAAVEEAEVAEVEEEKSETKPVRRGRVGSTDSDAQEAKKPAGRRGAATKRASAPEAVESTPPVEEKKRRVVKKPLDDVELKHEGKGHAADIHANHVPDEGTAEEEAAPLTRATRGKKAVHFDVASPAKATRGTRGKAAGPAVVLERDPEIDNLATASKEEEELPKTTKRGRAKAEAVTEESAESPAKKRGARGKKAEPEQAEQAAPSPRRTRRGRN